MNLLKKRVLRLPLRTWGVIPLLAWACMNLFFFYGAGNSDYFQQDRAKNRLTLPIGKCNVVALDGCDGEQGPIFCSF